MEGCSRAAKPPANTPPTSIPRPRTAGRGQGWGHTRQLQQEPPVRRGYALGQTEKVPRWNLQPPNTVIEMITPVA